MARQAAVEQRSGRFEPVELRELPRSFVTLERDRGDLWGRRWVPRRGERVHARQDRIWRTSVGTLELCLKDSSASFHATIAFLFIASWHGLPARSAFTRTPAVWASTNCAGRLRHSGNIDSLVRDRGVIKGHEGS